MIARLRKIQIPIMVVALAILSYGLMIPSLGFYSDDWTFLWITQRFGGSALIFHYLTNRPFLWFLTAPLIFVLRNAAWKYEVFFLVTRILFALSLYWLLKLVWPRIKQLGVIGALIGLLYPGYTVWPEAILSSRHMILLFSLLCSFSCSVLVIRQREHRRLWMALAIILGGLNQLFSDYYLFLEFTRPVWIWMVYSETEPSIKQKIKQIIIQCGPFWIVFCLVMYWRLFCFPNLESWYQVSFFSNLQQAPLSFLLDRVGQVLKDFWTVLGPGMIGLFGFPHISSEGRPVLIMFIAGFLAAGLIFLNRYHLFLKWDETGKKDKYSVIIIGLLAMVFAGPVFWIVGIPLSISFSSTRFLLPFLPGACLVFAGLLSLLPKKSLTVAVLSLWVGVAVAANLRTANFYRIDWMIQRRLLTEITQRFPDLEPGTMVVSEEIPTILPSSTFLSAYLNWVYAQDVSGFPEADYLFNYIAHDMEDISPDHFRTSYDILNAYPFRGSSSRILGVAYINDCLVVLDPQLDGLNPDIPTNIQELSAFSRPELILPDRVSIPSELLFTQNEDSIFPWCRSFLAADLAAQYGQWDTVAQIADSDLAAFPQDSSMGRFFTVFIEGYANVGRAAEAVQLTNQVITLDPEMNPLMCSLWNRILQENPDSIDAGEIQSLIPCP